MVAVGARFAAIGQQHCGGEASQKMRGSDAGQRKKKKKDAGQRKRADACVKKGKRLTCVSHAGKQRE